MSAPATIIIPAFNEVDYCRQCVSSLLLHTPPEVKLVLVDNGSTDGAGEFFDSVPGATVVHTAENRGFAGGVNAGLAHAEGHAVVLNSDTLLPREWLARLLAHFEADPLLGMVGPRTNCASGPQHINGLAFHDLEGISAFADQRAVEFSGQRVLVPRLVGFCLVIRDTTLAAVGTFDERFGIGNFEDDDYGMRVRKAGWRLAMAEDCFVFHYGSRTFAGMGIVGERFNALIAANADRFARKWPERGPRSPETAAQAGALQQAAQDAYTRGDLAAALARLTEALRLLPDDAGLHSDLGVVLWKLGDQARARACFERALRLAPGHEGARENLAALEAAPQSDEEPSD